MDLSADDLKFLMRWYAIAMEAGQTGPDDDELAGRILEACVATPDEDYDPKRDT